MRIKLTPRQMLFWGTGLAVTVVAVLLPDMAFAGYCYGLSDCVGGNGAAGGAVLIGAGVGGGLVSLVALDGGHTGNGDAVDLTQGAASPPPEAPASQPMQSENKFGELQ